MQIATQTSEKLQLILWLRSDCSKSKLSTNFKQRGTDPHKITSVFKAFFR